MYQHFQEEPPAAASAYPAHAADISVDNAALPRLEDYLDQVFVPLIGELPYNARWELRQEIRQHLVALIQAYQEVGDTAEIAMEKALVKFGDPAAVARQWKPAGFRKTKRFRPAHWLADQWQGIGVTLTLCSLLGLFGLALRSNPAVVLPLQGQTGIRSETQVASRQVPTAIRQTGFRHSMDIATVTCQSCHRDNISASAAAFRMDQNHKQWTSAVSQSKSSGK